MVPLSWDQWFEACWQLPVQPARQSRFGPVHVTHQPCFSSSLFALASQLPCAGDVRLLSSLPDQLCRLAPFTQHQRSNTGVIPEGLHYGFSLEWEPIQRCLWIHHLSSGRSLGVHPDGFMDRASKPLVEFLHWRAISATNACLVHAAVLENRGRGLLILGSGEAGKSTTVAAALMCGFTACGEDYVWLQPHDEGVLAMQVYRSLKLRPNSPLLAACHSAPLLTTHPSFSRPERTVFLLHDDLCSSAVVIKAVLALESRRSVEQPRAVQAEQILAPLIHSTIRQAPAGHAVLLRRIRALGLHKLPAWKIGHLPVDGVLQEALLTLLEKV